MKKANLFLILFLFVSIFAFTGCGSDKKDTESTPLEDDAELTDPEEIEAAFEDELTPVEGDELAMLEDPEDGGFSEDDELTPLSEEEIEQLENESEADQEELDDSDSASSDDSASDDVSADKNGIAVEEDGTYTTKEEVAVYIHTYGHLPSNYITSEEAEKLGWDSSKNNLEKVAPGKSIGGDSYTNEEKMLPEEDGRTYQECDIDYDGGTRTDKRIIYSNDGLVFYTGDLYETFEQIY